MQLPTTVSDWSFSPDGTRIASVSTATGSQSLEQSNRTLHVWDAGTGAALVGPITYDSELIIPIRFNPDGKQILMATLDGTSRLWDAATGLSVGRPMAQDAGVTEAHVSLDGVIWTARFGHDGKSIVTASSDGTARLWDARSHLPLTGPMRHDWPVRFALPSDNGRHVITILVDRQKMRLWPVLTVSATEAWKLADLAEAVGGYKVDENNAVIALPDRPRALETLRISFRTPREPSDLDLFLASLWAH